MELNLFKKSIQIYWIWLSLKLGNQNSSFQRLLELFGNSPYRVYVAKEDELRRARHLSESEIRVLLDKDLGEATTIYTYCKSNNVGILAYGDSYYPELLKSMKKPPVLLYYMGTLPNLNNKICVSVVGTRKMTEYGMRSGYKISYELAHAGAVVVSGMALGVDAAAHAGAIGGGGLTVAVLGCGIDVIYPKAHRKLRKYICENGVVLTAYHPGSPAYKNHFPERNAIISALSEGTLVIESPAHSGALITADYASEQSRTVYALPGSIEEPNSEGPNGLIKKGAVAITCARDILNYYFENHSSLVDAARLREAEQSSEYDNKILAELGIADTCHGRGSKGTPAALLKKLNEELFDNEKQNGDYYAVPKIKRIGEQDKAPETEADRKKNDSATESILATLSEEQRKIFDELPCDRPVSLDALCAGGINIGTLMATLTILEIKGLISSLPGGMYIRK